MCASHSRCLTWPSIKSSSSQNDCTIHTWQTGADKNQCHTLKSEETHSSDACVWVKEQIPRSTFSLGRAWPYWLSADSWHILEEQQTQNPSQGADACFLLTYAPRWRGWRDGKGGWKLLTASELFIMSFIQFWYFLKQLFWNFWNFIFLLWQNKMKTICGRSV